MNIIDALVVTLGLDSKDLESKTPAATKKLADLEKQGDKTEKSVAKISKTSKETARNTAELSRVVTSFLTIIGGTVAVKAFIQDFINTNAQLDRLSKNLGLSVSTISAWSNATEKLGGSAQGLQGTLDMLSKSQTQLMLTGESSLLPYMSALGVSLADVNGKARPVTDILLDLSDRFGHMDRTTANNLGRMMGFDQGTLNLLLSGRKELELEIARQKEQTAVTAAQAAQAQKFQTQIAGIKQQFMALGRSLLMDAAPTIEKLFDLLQRFGTWAQTHEQFIGDFLKVIAVGLGAIAIAAMPINLTVVAVVALAGAIALLWDDYQTWKKGGESFIDWGKWEPAITAATNGIKALGAAIEYAFEWYEKMYSKVTGGRNFKNDFDAGVSALGINGGTNMNGRASRVNARDIQKFFTDRGWTPAQASGIAANLMSESSGNMRAVGDNGKAFGLGQWHADRQAAFKKWSGHDIQTATLGEQLAFVQYELTRGGEQSAGNALRGATSADQAGAIISKQYERPADANGEASRRGAYAQSLMGAGAGSSTTNVDRSVKTQIGSITVNTQATDASGMARDMDHALDYLFVSQANAGLT